MTTTSHYVRLWPHRTFLGLVGMSAGAIQELLKILFGKITKFVRDGKGEASGSTTIKPSGLATCEAIFARCLVRATPIEIGRPTSTRTRRRTAAAISDGAPKRWVQPATSAKASSMEIRSRRGVK